MKQTLKRFTAALATGSWLAPAIVRAAAIDDGLSRIRPEFGIGGSLGNSQTPTQFIGNIIRLLLGIAGAVAVLFIIYGGYLYITSAGNSEQAEKGRTTLTNALIGVVIIILSYVMVTVIVNLVSRGQV